MVLPRLAYLASFIGSAIAATSAEWRSQSVYFMLTDRFARSDGSTTAACDTDSRVGLGFCLHLFLSVMLTGLK
jgi:alpha-amylase